MSLCLIATSDLMGYSRLAQTARAAGLEPVQVKGASGVQAAVPRGDIAALMVDLTDASGGPEAVQAGVAAGLYVVAIGPHVQKELFDEARQAGAHTVLPHSATGERLAEVLRNAATSGTDPAPGAQA